MTHPRGGVLAVGGLKFSMAQKKLKKVPVGKVPVGGSASWGKCQLGGCQLGIVSVEGQARKL